MDLPMDRVHGQVESHEELTIMSGTYPEDRHETLVLPIVGYFLQWGCRREPAIAHLAWLTFVTGGSKLVLSESALANLTAAAALRSTCAFKHTKSSRHTPTSLCLLTEVCTARFAIMSSRQLPRMMHRQAAVTGAACFCNDTVLELCLYSVWRWFKTREG